MNVNRVWLEILEEFVIINVEIMKFGQTTNVFVKVDVED